MESWMLVILCCFFFFSSRRRHTRFDCDWSSDVCSSDLAQRLNNVVRAAEQARECEEQRKKSQFSKAVDAARKALAIEPNLPAARSEERRVGKSVDLGGRRIIKKKKRRERPSAVQRQPMQTTEGD